MSSARLPGAQVLLVALALLAATPSAFAIKIAYTVGGDGPGICDAANIPAAIALAKANPPHVVHVTRSTAYSAQAITIDSQDLLIVGGFTSCSDFSEPSVHTTISGAGNGGQSVFTVTGISHVTLSHLTISDAPSPLKGGGINVLGAGSLDLADVTVSNNQATSGGGIYVSTSGGDETLTLNDNVLIQDNSAGSFGDGGGIYLAGTAHLLMSGSGTQVSTNHADSGFGGGIYAIGPAQADIGAPGIGTHGAIYNNTADSGAGIFIEGGGSAGLAASVTLFTTDPAHPVFLDSNVSFGSGSALFVNTNGAPAIACLFDVRISGNSAPIGSVLSSSGQVYMNTNPGGVCNSAALAAAVRCTPGPGCNEISGNTDSNPQQGVGLISTNGGTLQMDRVIFRGLNTSVHAIASDGQSMPLVSNCLISGNHFSQELIDVTGSDFTLDGCTVANNTVDSHFLFKVETGNAHHFVLTNSIIAEAANYKTFNNAGGDGILEAHYDLLSDTSTVSQGDHFFYADPQFLDADYHLQPTSPAIDFAPAAGGVDVDGNPRDVVVYDDITPRDIGAQEYQIGVPDRFFADGFERL